MDFNKFEVIEKNGIKIKTYNTNLKDLKGIDLINKSYFDLGFDEYTYKTIEDVFLQESYFSDLCFNCKEFSAYNPEVYFVVIHECATMVYLNGQFLISSRSTYKPEKKGEKVISINF